MTILMFGSQRSRFARFLILCRLYCKVGEDSIHLSVDCHRPLSWTSCESGLSQVKIFVSK